MNKTIVVVVALILIMILGAILAALDLIPSKSGAWMIKSSMTVLVVYIGYKIGTSYKKKKSSS